MTALHVLQVMAKLQSFPLRTMKTVRCAKKKRVQALLFTVNVTK